MEKTADVAGVLPVSFRLLFSLYLAVPFCFALYLIDVFALNGFFLSKFPLAPERYFFTALIFGVPHIVASNVILATNTEYLSFYKSRLLKASLVIIAFLVFSEIFLSSNMTFFIIATATILHVLRQQLGIGNILARLSGPVYETWYWSVLVGSVFMYNAVYVGDEYGVAAQQWTNYAMIVFGFLVVASAIVLYPRIKDGVAQGYFLGNTALCLSGFFFYSQKYLFLAILGGRIVHDVTAFIFYVTHDRNRHLQGPKNMLYRVLDRAYIHPFVAVPIVAIALAFVLQFQFASSGGWLGRLGSLFLVYLHFLHYYTESFTWKGLSPYRKHISFQR